MTTGDGWTPGPQSKALARWLDGKLKSARLELDDDLSRSAKLVLGRDGPGKQDTWWLSRWNTFSQGDKSAELNTLPRRRDDASLLPEAQLLKPIIFGGDPNGRRRLAIVQSIAKSKAADYESLCQNLSLQFASDPTICRLGDFAKLAESGLAAMDHVSQVLRGKPSVKLSEVSKGNEAKEICKSLQRAAQAWLAVPEMTLRHANAATRFAQVMAATVAPIDCFRQLLRHHETYGGGLRWFILRNEHIESRTPSNGDVSRYGFRLWALCRMAAQCGVTKNIPSALHDDFGLEDEDE
jgi:hypothetical protein